MSRKLTMETKHNIKRLILLKMLQTTNSIVNKIFMVQTIVMDITITHTIGL